MKKWSSALTAALMVFSLLPLSSASANETKQGVQPDQVVKKEQTPAPDSGTDELIVKYKEGADLTKLADKHKGQIEKAGKQIGKLKTGLIKLAKGTDKKAMIEKLQADPDVEYVQPNYVYQAAGFNDTYYELQKYNYLERVGAEEAWKVTMGSPTVSIAVIDTGVKTSDQDIKPNLLPGINTIDGSTNTDDDSPNRHGTNVAGIIGAVPDNGIGIAGIAGKSKILPVKALGASGMGYDIDIADGIVWAVDHGAKIINLSFTSTHRSQLVQDAINYATLKGAVTVASTGNQPVVYGEPERIYYPAALSNVIAVTSNLDYMYYPQKTSYIDTEAPGAYIYTTDGSTVSGSSYAAAHVSGVAALILSTHPDYRFAQVENTLKYSTRNFYSEWGYGNLHFEQAVKSSASKKGDLILLADDRRLYEYGQDNHVIAFYQGFDGPATLKIYDSEKRLVKTLDQPTRTEISVGQGFYEFAWNAQDENGVFVPNGTYTYVLQATDANGVTTDPLTSSIKINRSERSASNVKISHDPFIVKGSNTTQISYELSRDSYVTVGIYNGTTLVRALSNSAPRKEGINRVLWDGRDNSEKFVADGTYTYRIQVEGSTAVSGPITVQKNLEITPLGTLFGHTIEPFVPDGKARGAVLFSPWSDASELYSFRVNTKVYNTSGQLVYTDTGVKLKGNIEIGSIFADKNKFPDGVYKVSLDVFDLAGRYQTTVTDMINIQHNPQLLRGYETEYRDSEAGIRYELLNNANVTVRVYNSNNQLVRTLVENRAQDTGMQTAVWDFQDDARNYMQSGAYKWVVEAVDASGKTATVSGILMFTRGGYRSSVYGTVSGTTFTYTVYNEPANINLVIYNEQIQRVRTIPLGLKDVGNYEIRWDGKDDQGAVLPDGSYSFMFELTALDNYYREEYPRYFVKQPEPSDFYDVMRYDQNGQLTFTFSSQKGAKDMTMKIYNSAGTLVQTLPANIRFFDGQYQAVWVGPKVGTNPAPAGVYRYVLEGKSSANVALRPLSSNFTWDPQRKLIREASINQQVFNPDGKNSVEIELLARGWDLKVSICQPYEGYGMRCVREISRSDSGWRSNNAGRSRVYWDGRDSEGRLVEDGNYFAVVSAQGDDYYSTGNMETVKLPLTVDGDYPMISGLVTVWDDYNYNDETQQEFTLSESALVQAGVYDTEGNLISTLVDRQRLPEGTNRLKWNGLNDRGVQQPNKEYIFKVFLLGSSGEIVNQAEKRFHYRMAIPVVSDVKMDRNPFYTHSAEELMIEYNVSEEFLYTIVRIYNKAGEEVYVMNGSFANYNNKKQYVLWNGMAYDSNYGYVYAPPGEYTFKIQWDDHQTYTRHELDGGTFTVIKKPIVSVFAEGLPDVAHIQYTVLDWDASAKVEIYNSNNELVRAFDPAEMLYLGETKQFEWDYKTTDGTLVPEGVYTYKVTATSQNYGGRTEEYMGTFKYDTQTPVITSPTVTGYVDTATGAQAILTYQTSQPVKTTVFVYEENGTLPIKKLLLNQDVTAGPVTVQWDGTNEAGEKVATGTYRFVITGTDAESVTAETSVPVYVNERQGGFGTTITDSPDPFKANGTVKSNIQFEFISGGVPTVELFDSQDQLVRTIKGATYSANSAVSIGWDGKNDAGVVVEDGTYTYRLSGTDPAGVPLKPVMGGTITTDKTAPVVSKVTTTPSPFDPTRDTNMSLSYELSEDSNVSINVYNSANSLIKTLVSNVANTAGSHSVTWDGKNSSGILVPKGTYTFRIAATDNVGWSTNASGTVAVELPPQPPVISNVSDSPDPLKVTETTASTIYYTLNEAANVTVRVYDSKGVMVRTLLDNTPNTAGAKPIAWNGKNDAGALVEDGTYTYKIDAVNAAGLSATTVSGTITTDKNAPTMTNLTATPNPFVRTGSNMVEFKYDLNENAKVTVSIYNASNALVKTLESAVPKSAGTNSITWDGKNSSGVLVPAGAYTYRLLATDAVGLSRNAQGVFNVELPVTTPVISSVSDKPDPFKVTGTTASTIYYSLSEEAKVSLRIYDSSNTLVRTLIDSVLTASGPRSVAWDGKNDAGALVEDGTYTYKINAVNAAGRAATEMSGTITTDKNAPVVSNLTATPNPFNPSASRLTIKYDLNEDANVTLGIYNTSGVLVKQLLSVVPNKTGTNSVLWDGKDTNGNVVPNGSYSYRLLASDKVGLSRNASGVFKVDSAAAVSAPVITNVSDAPDPLKLTGTSTSQIYYTLSKAANVSIKIYDGTDKLIRTLVDNVAQTAGAKPAAWNGKDDAGNLVEDGTYTYVITAIDSAGVAGIEAKGTITTDKNAPVISSLTATPNPFNPKTTATLSIGYTLNEDSKVTVSIYNASNVLVRTISSAVLNKAGTNTVTWDGKDNNGALVPNASYVYRVIATDLAGLSRSAQSVVKVESL